MREESYMYNITIFQMHPSNFNDDALVHNRVELHDAWSFITFHIHWACNDNFENFLEVDFTVYPRLTS